MEYTIVGKVRGVFLEKSLEEDLNSLIVSGE